MLELRLALLGPPGRRKLKLLTGLAGGRITGSASAGREQSAGRLLLPSPHSLTLRVTCFFADTTPKVVFAAALPLSLRLLPLDTKHNLPPSRPPSDPKKRLEKNNPLPHIRSRDVDLSTRLLFSFSRSSFQRHLVLETNYDPSSLSRPLRRDHDLPTLTRHSTPPPSVDRRSAAYVLYIASGSHTRLS